MSVKVSDMRFRGVVSTNRRIVLPKKICEKLGIDEGTFYEGQVYSAGDHPKILLTFIR